MRQPTTRPIRLARRAAVLATTVLAGLGAATGAASAATPPCVPVEIVIARGTGEPGPLGVIVGDPFAAALTSKFAAGRVRAYPVNYPASSVSDSVARGVADIVQHVEAGVAACPRTRYVLVGFSQGALVTSGAIGAPAFGGAFTPLSETASKRVVAVLLFGNVLQKIGQQDTGAYESRTRHSCFPADPICTTGTEGLAHFGYILGDSVAGADFASDKLWASCVEGDKIYFDTWCKELYWP